MTFMCCTVQPVQSPKSSQHVKIISVDDLLVVFTLLHEACLCLPFIVELLCHDTSQVEGGIHSVSSGFGELNPERHVDFEGDMARAAYRPFWGIDPCGRSSTMFDVSASHALQLVVFSMNSEGSNTVSILDDCCWMVIGGPDLVPFSMMPKAKSTRWLETTFGQSSRKR